MRPNSRAEEAAERFFGAPVNFEDATVIDPAKQDFESFELIKPMVWWWKQ